MVVPFQAQNEWVFRGFWLRYLCIWAGCGAGSLACFVLGLAWFRPLLVVSLLFVGIGLAYGLSYVTQAVIIRGQDLILRQGNLRAYEHVMPIWQVALEIDQTLLGRLCDFGTIRCRFDGQVLEMHYIANIHTVRRLIATRRRLTLG